MASLIKLDETIDSTNNSINPAALIPNSMVSFIDNEKLNLKQVASNFVVRCFDIRISDFKQTLNVVQLMSEYDGNFSTPVCYL